MVDVTRILLKDPQQHGFFPFMDTILAFILKVFAENIDYGYSDSNKTESCG
jgi:hypothetical protein